MRKLILLIASSLTIVCSSFAQSKLDTKQQNFVNNFITKVESKIELTPKEKTKLVGLKTEHAKAFFKVNAKHKKDTPKRKEKRKEINNAFIKSLSSAFGKTRAREIMVASRKNKHSSNLHRVRLVKLEQDK